jgi:tetratricopeptide (TPR) repeat protein
MKTVKVISMFACSVIIAGALHSYGETTMIPIPETTSAARLAREGRGLSAIRVSELEDRLKNTPHDLPARARLLGYYFSTADDAIGSEATRQARRRHILWLIEHHPENDITSLSEFTIDPAGHPLADADGYEQAKKLWLDQINQCKDDVRVLTHAALFFKLSDKALAITCLKQATQLAPDNRELSAQLGYMYALTALGITMITQNGLPASADPAEATGELATRVVTELRASSNSDVIGTAGGILYMYGMMMRSLAKSDINRDALAEELLLRASALDPDNPGIQKALSDFYAWSAMLAEREGRPEERKTLEKKALEQAKRVVDQTKGDRTSHLYALRDALKMAIDADEFDEAQRFATDLLKQVADPPDISEGQHFHDGHVVLGRVALKDGEVEKAKAHLLQAGRTPGGGTLTSFGPNMTLAKELSEKGEFETVIEYLELCRSFWPDPKLNRWIQTLQDGKVPNFGANLNY